MTKFSNLKKGEILSEIQFYTVEKIAADKVQLKNDEGEFVVVDSKYVDNALTSADQFEKEEVVTKTVAAEIFLTHPYVSMTVCYNKQVKEADVVKEIMNAYEASSPKEIERSIKRAVKNGLNGVERIMRGRSLGHKDEFGRVAFIDMELDKTSGKEYDTRQRLVDPRTINWLIVNGVRYKVK